jgi:FixJ family two-component response regulator
MVPAPLIAVVDDDESVRKALVRLLRSVNLTSLAFPSAQAFLDVFDELAIDCLVLDLQMPDMTGLELQRHLRKAHPDAHVPVIIITAHDEPGSRERCVAAGASAYLRKPLDSSVLLAVIDKVIANADRGGESRLNPDA